MRSASIGVLAWLLAGSGIVDAAPAASSRAAKEIYYQYENAEGVTVIDDNVPPKFAHKGYTVIDKYGRVLETVPRSLSAEELKRSGSSELKLRLQAEQAAQQRKYDELLLARYSSLADIDDARTRKVNEVKVRINSLKGTVASLSSQVEQRQQEAADLERNGEPVPEKLTQSIAALRQDIAKAEKSIAEFESERRKTEARFQYDMERFRVLHPEVPRPPSQSLPIKPAPLQEEQ